MKCDKGVDIVAGELQHALAYLKSPAPSKAIHLNPLQSRGTFGGTDNLYPHDIG